MAVRLDHAGLNVADLDAASAFYARAFGFAVEVRFELPGGIRGAMLDLPAGGRLELFERPGSAPGPAPESPIAALATRGYGHCALSAPDIDAVYGRALEAGAAERVSPRPSPEPGVRFAFVADPEGNLVELVERR
jgi:catechol 2,3-dioxygenase-like lactoylglutathione lyase family enzyme